MVIALILIGGAIAFALWKTASQDTKAPKTPRPEGSTQEYTTDPALVSEVNQKYGAGDYKGAIKRIEEQKNTNDVGTQLLLAGAYANSGDVKKALSIYKTIDKEGRLPNTALGNMAEMAERAGDYRTALDAYKRAKQYAVSSGTETQDQIAVYDYKIAELEKKQ